MSLAVDSKYLALLSGKLDRFVQKDRCLWNFRCPFCGDSEKNKSKARGYCFEKSQSLLYKCHNCGHTTNISGLIKKLEPNIHQHYVLESFKSSGVSETRFPNRFLKESSGEKFSRREKLGIPAVSDLPKGHPARTYCESRKIPQKALFLLHYAEDWADWCEKKSPGKYNFPPKEKRLVIPFWNESGKLVGAQGRQLFSSAIGKNIRYVSMRIREEPLVFGIEQVNPSKKVYVVEGPIDSLFLPNAIAVAGSNLKAITTKKWDCTYCWDNENRNSEILTLMQGAINTNKNLFIWPDHFSEKDINELVVNKNYTESQLVRLITDNTYRGLKAQIRFNQWKKR